MTTRPASSPASRAYADARVELDAELAKLREHLDATVVGDCRNANWTDVAEISRITTMIARITNPDI